MNTNLRTILLAIWLGVSGITSAVETPEGDADLAKLEDLAASEIEEPNVGRWYGTPEWKALVRLAQLGRGNAAEKAISVARRQSGRLGTGKSTGAVETLVILEQVASIRQPEAVGFLKEYLDSDERLPDLDGGVPGTLIAQRAALLLASIVADFPVKHSYETDYTNEDIRHCRDWMNSHRGDWRIISPDAAGKAK